MADKETEAIKQGIIKASQQGGIRTCASAILNSGFLNVKQMPLRQGMIC